MGIEAARSRAKGLVAVDDYIIVSLQRPESAEALGGCGRSRGTKRICLLPCQEEVKKSSAPLRTTQLGGTRGGASSSHSEQEAHELSLQPIVLFGGRIRR